jgi:hypothetical protein
MCLITHERLSRTSIFYSVFQAGFEKDSVFGYTPCNSRRFIWQGMAYIRVAFQTWIPTIIVFVFNCLMFWKLRKIKVNRKRLQGNVNISLTNQLMFNKKFNQLIHFAEFQRKTGENGHRRNMSFISRPSPTNPMLIAVSLAYLVMVFPLGAVQTAELYWNVHRKTSVATFGTLKEDYVYWYGKNTPSSALSCDLKVNLILPLGKRLNC